MCVAFLIFHTHCHSGWHTQTQKKVEENGLGKKWEERKATGTTMSSGDAVATHLKCVYFLFGSTIITPFDISGKVHCVSMSTLYIVRFMCWWLGWLAKSQVQMMMLIMVEILSANISTQAHTHTFCRRNIHKINIQTKLNKINSQKLWSMLARVFYMCRKCRWCRCQCCHLIIISTFFHFFHVCLSRSSHLCIQKSTTIGCVCECM